MSSPTFHRLAPARSARQRAAAVSPLASRHTDHHGSPPTVSAASSNEQRARPATRTCRWRRVLATLSHPGSGWASAVPRLHLRHASTRPVARVAWSVRVRCLGHEKKMVMMFLVFPF